MLVTKQLDNFVCNPGNSPLGPYTLSIPAGLRVQRIKGGMTHGMFWLDQFPLDLFPSFSFLRHDAIHYGIVLTPEQVTEEN